MSFHSYNLELGAILRRLPLCFYEKGRLGAIRAAYANGYANRLWNREQAVRVAFLANMESAEGHGKGNKARRREARLPGLFRLAGNPTGKPQDRFWIPR